MSSSVVQLLYTFHSSPQSHLHAICVFAFSSTQYYDNDRASGLDVEAIDSVGEMISHTLDTGRGHLEQSCNYHHMLT